MFARMLAAVLSVAMIGGWVAAAPLDTPKAKQHYQEALRLKKDKKYDEALDELDEALAADRKFVPALTERAWILNEQGKYDLAIKAGRAALKIDPDSADAWTEIGYAQMKQKNNSEAIKAFNSAIEANPKKWVAYDYLAQAYEANGDEEKADRIRAKKKRLMKEDD